MTGTSLPLWLGAAAISLLVPNTAAPPKVENAVMQQLRDIATRYSRHLDTTWDGRGWGYAVPSQSYQENDRSSAGNLRMQLTFASFYRFRQDEPAIAKVRAALTDALIALPRTQPNAVTVRGKEVSTRSFHEAIGLFLALRILQQRPKILSATERATALDNIKTMLPWVLRAEDTENRAIIGAAYGLAILKNPLLTFTPQEQEQYRQLIRQKVAIGLKSVDAKFRYREGKDLRFSLHYHLVSADLLAYLGKNMSDPRYTATSNRMLQYVHDAYPKGALDWQGSARPAGIGFQTVLLRAIGEKYLGNDRWQQYWNAERAGRGFIDPRAPDRLVWRDEADSTYNDDYSLANMAELFWGMMSETN